MMYLLMNLFGWMMILSNFEYYYQEFLVFVSEQQKETEINQVCSFYSLMGV